MGLSPGDASYAEHGEVETRQEEVLDGHLQVGEPGLPDLTEVQEELAGTQGTREGEAEATVEQPQADQSEKSEDHVEVVAAAGPGEEGVGRVLHREEVEEAREDQVFLSRDMNAALKANVELDPPKVEV